MKLNLRKLDTRIQKLQEIRRIATDPELVAMLLEFIHEDELPEAVPASKSTYATEAPSADDIDMVDHVLKGLDTKASAAWAAKRA